MIVFKVDNDIQGSFACGSGIMFSTERKSEEKRLQWVVILRIGENYDPLTSECSDERNAPLIQTELAARADILNVSDTLFEQGDAVKAADLIIEPILREPMPRPNGFYIDFDCLKARQDFLYEEVYGNYLKKISFKTGLERIQGDPTIPGGQHAAPLTDPIDISLWNTLLTHQNQQFTTSGRGKRPGKPFTYLIRGAEIFISTRSKSITRATILYAFRKVREMNEQGIVITGPKSIGVHGDSYIFAVFNELGVINGSTLDIHDMISVLGNLEETELKSMPRPKGSKNKKAITTEISETVESIDERIAAAEAAIETLTINLKAKKAELKQLVKMKAEAEAVAAKKKAEEDKAAILAAVEASGKSVDEILELLK